MQTQTAYTPAEERRMERKLEEILNSSYQPLDESGRQLIRKAFETAKEAHARQRRKSGEPFIFHPLEVAHIVAEQIGLDATSIAAALLHDTIEDTDITAGYIRREFGEKITQIVEGLTKIKKLPKDKDFSIQAENFRKLILTLNEDVRVILIKIADRLHNMRTMDSMPRHKQEKIASETLYIYAPLAHRMGLYQIKTELEDLSLKYIDPEAYDEIVRKLKETEEDRRRYIEKFAGLVDARLKELGISYTITGRPKSIFSIYRKMKEKKVDFEDIYDIFAIRIIYKPPEPRKEKMLAWDILSTLTDQFKYNPNRMRNWLDWPRSTGYQALHITVLGPDDKWVEVQIRSERMNEIAEKGYAAHYKYKQGSDEAEELGVEKWLSQLQEILKNPEGNALDFLDEIRLDLYSDEIHVLTPKGDVVSLPKGATVLDFAFHIHTEVGMHTRAAEVNGRIVPLNYVLNSGDLVHIITSPQQKPRQSWLNIATTGRARNKIKAYLRQQEKEIIQEGKEILRRKLRHLKLKTDDKIIGQLQKYFKLPTSKDLFYKVGTGEIGNKELKAFVNAKNNFFLKFFQSPWKRKKEPEKKKVAPAPVEEVNYDLIVFGQEDQRLDYTLANCCNPLPGDEIFGFVTVNEGIKVHKKTCPNAIFLRSRHAHRIIPARWTDSTKQTFKVKLKITGADRPGIVADITRLVSLDMGYRLVRVEFDDKSGFFEGTIIVDLQNTAQLKELMLRIKEIEGVEKIEKI
ncbi:MAG: bifunctional (p)ppGpp synthetase/guanosine-3',5'-bis(diphosphate) 3'-pyrophosphohydrolase [Chlorobi bacterium]|nr:bifunctional (p)ppGpp synthetase/guanosine-3',5'-bis(diphosphate) 3'-pyrophosphohydrolase [Chlorobiota bacterium]